MFTILRNEVVLYLCSLNLNRYINYFKVPVHKVPDNQLAAKRLIESIHGTYDCLNKMSVNTPDFVRQNKIALLYTAVSAYGLAVTLNYGKALAENLRGSHISPDLKCFESDSKLSKKFEKQCKKLVSCIENHFN